MLFDFEVIHCFEPSGLARRELDGISDNRVIVHPFGLASRDGDATLYQGQLSFSASLFPDKLNVDPSNTEACKIRRASRWLKANIVPGDLIVAKINAEGAEVEILEDLEKAGLLQRFKHLIAFLMPTRRPHSPHEGLCLSSGWVELGRVFGRQRMFSRARQRT